MEDDIEPTSNTLLPMAVSVFAVLLGGAALYFGLTANQRLVVINEALDTGSTNVAKAERQFASYETKIVELEELVAEQRKIVERLRIYVAQSDKAVKSMNSEVTKNREQIVKNAKSMANLVSVKPQRSPSVEVPTSPRAELQAKVTDQEKVQDPGDQKPLVEEGFYEIQPGDTLLAVAGKIGIPLQALLDANPDVDPRRLRIGQKIIIPSE